MSTINKKELFDEPYDSALVTTGAVAMSMVAKKIGGMQLNMPETLRGIVKLGVAVAVSTMGMKYSQQTLLVNRLKRMNPVKVND